MKSLAELPVTAPEALEAWEANVRPSRVLFGPGRLREIGRLAAELGGRRVLGVTDAGIRRAGHGEVAVSALEAEGLGGAVFDAVEENPTSALVERGAEEARRHAPELLVGLGGGSAMDCAKGINFLLTNGGRMEDYAGFGKARLPLLPSLAVPCTAGTGSEAQSFALITRDSDHVKMACGDPKARFRAVILDPEVVQTAPHEVAMVAGFDALSHAVESRVTRSGNPLSRLLAREAWRLMERAFPALASRSGTGSDWADMLWGAHLAGSAIELSMLGAAHACANPLTATFGVTHGRAIGLVLPAVVRCNGPSCLDAFAELLAAGGGGGETAGDPAEALARRLEALRDAAGLPARLGAIGIDETAIPGLVAQALQQWTLRHNPRQLGAEALAAIYRSAL
ncbi:MAG: iron-containing alcohol dehydrogenase [Thermoanaerobaculia bacterium]|nr:iron-containing alcohol dehydrogenase [Thermoanaerobaculia bacterium]